MSYLAFAIRRLATGTVIGWLVSVRNIAMRCNEFFAALGVWNLGKSGFSGPMHESGQSVVGSCTIFKHLFVICQ